MTRIDDSVTRLSEKMDRLVYPAWETTLKRTSGRVATTRQRENE
jgi:hypothetical protein